MLPLRGHFNWSGGVGDFSTKIWAERIAAASPGKTPRSTIA